MTEPPLPQGPAPLLNRAWARRGWASAPRFGRTVSPLMAETTITINRRARGLNATGGFRGGAPEALYTGPAHVERAELGRPVPGSSLVDSSGATVPHDWEVFIDDPAGLPALPANGDMVTFSDGFTSRTLPIVWVDMPAGLTDHAELWLSEPEST